MLNTAIVSAVLPVFLIILLGYFLRSQRFPVYGFWRQAERMTYVVFLPTLLFKSLATSALEWAQFSSIGIIVLLAFSLQAALCFIVKYIFNVPAKTFASLFQGSIRFNNYIGIGLIAALFGDVGITVYAVILATAIPIATLSTVAIMSHYASGHDFSLKSVLRRLAFNPLIIGTAGGILVNVINTPITIALPLIDMVANAALPIGLMCVGAAINRQEVQGAKFSLVLVMMLKLTIFPIVMALIIYLFFKLGLVITNTEKQVLVLFAALPCAASNTTIARQFGAQVSLAANATALTTLTALLTLPLILWILQ